MTFSLYKTGLVVLDLFKMPVDKKASLCHVDAKRVSDER